MKAIIHIGTPKTGTTTIQNFLFKNFGALKKQGVFVPKGNNRWEHFARHLDLCAAIMVPGMQELRPLFPVRGYRSFRHIFRCEKNFTSEFQRKLWEKIQNEIKSNCSKNDLVLFSAEHFSSRTSEEVERLKQLMSSLFDDVTIVVYLRRQSEYLVSRYGQDIKTGATREIFDYLNDPEERSFLAYHKLIEWWSIFGKDKLKIRLFDRKEFLDNDLLSDFAYAAGFDLKGLERIRDANVSMDSAYIEFLRLLNLSCPAMRNPWKLDHFRSQLYSSLRAVEKAKLKHKKAYYLNRSEAQRIIDHCQEGNDWIAREYLGREKLFSDDVSMYPEEVASPHHLTLEQCAEITVALCQQIEQQRKKRLFDRFKKMLTRIKEGVSKMFGR